MTQDWLHQAVQQHDQNLYKQGVIDGLEKAAEKCPECVPVLQQTIHKLRLFDGPICEYWELEK